MRINRSSYNRPASRLAKKQQKNMIRQSVFFLIAAIVIGLIFVIYVLPFSINVFFKFLDKGQSVSSQNSLPPQVPILAAPIDATNSAQITLTGYGQIGSQEVLVVNGSEASRNQVADDGTFSFQFDLSEGDNKVAVYAIGDNKQESALSKEYDIKLDTQAPTIELQSPKDGDNISGKNNQNLTITGKTEPSVKVYVNDRLFFADKDGNFSIPFRLSEGKNEITIRAVDAATNSVENKLTVNFSL